MDKKKLRKLIKKLVKEYTGTGASGGNAGDGNSITSPRPFADDVEELENYIHKSIYGGDGGHYKGEPVTPNYNRTKMAMFEKQVDEQLDPSVMQRFTDKKTQIQKDLANVDIDISKETMKAAAKTSLAQLNQTRETLTKAESDLTTAVEEKNQIEDRTNQVNQELEALNKLEIGVEISPKEKNEKVKELQSIKTNIQNTIKSAEEKIDKAKEAKQQVLTQRNQITKSLGQQKQQIQKQINQQKKAVNQIGKTKPGQGVQEQAYGSATLTTQGPPRTGAIAPTDEYPFSRRPKRTATGMMENERLNEFTNSGQSGRYPEKENPGDMFQQKEVEGLLPKGMASRSDRAFQTKLKQHADWTEESGYNNTFVAVSYNETNFPEGEDNYFIHQTQHYNSNYDDFRSPDFTELYIVKNKDTNKEEKLGSYIVDTKSYIRDINILRSDGYLQSTVSENLTEFKTPKSFDPDTINLVREMLYAADVYHDELVDDADTDEISSYLDKRTGGTIIKFPHFNGPQGRGAMFGKETSDQIDSSKAKAKAAALKVYTQFKQYIEDYEISDASPAGVYGNIYLWVMFNSLAEDYTAPKGGTQSSQFEEINEFVGKELEDRNQPLYDKLVAGSGKSDTVEGEMLRAINRIIYRYYNDGDEYTTGYGTETAGPAHSFLVNANHPLKSAMVKIFGDGTNYEQTIKDALDTILDYIESRQGKYTPNNVGDMFDYEPEFEDDEYEEEDYDADYDEFDNEEQYQESALKKSKKGMTNIDEMNTCQTCGKQGHDANHHVKKDHEGKMAKSQLYKIHQYTERLMHMLPDNAQLPAWVQSKFTNAAHSIGAAFHYLDYETMSHQDNLMENVDSYKREVLLEGTMKKFFKMFDEEKSNEEVLRYYASRGVAIPEQFLSKARKQYESLKKQKLEIKFAEQEAKDFKSAPVIEKTTDEEKKLTSRLYKEKLDPVGQEDGDIDNDGDEDKTDQYLLKRRKAVSKAINKNKTK